MNGPVPPKLIITPPLLNSANPWATTLDHLKELYFSPYLGAITTRTSLIKGFPHDDSKHQYAFFSPASSRPRDASAAPGKQTGQAADKAEDVASLNNLGYSPIPLSGYLSFIESIHKELPADSDQALKPVIVSVTGSPSDVLKSYQAVCRLQPRVPNLRLAVEINLSCPNIPSAPPPAYSSEGITSYLSVLPSPPRIPVGFKIPPYTAAPQFDALVTALRHSATIITPTSLTKAPCRISFVTATNTLGSCLVLTPELENALPGATGLGGMAGPPLHPLALGNVRTLAAKMAKYPELHHIKVIGVGGVADADGYKRMRRVGADAVAVGTALGSQGIGVFEKIADGFEDDEKEEVRDSINGGGVNDN